LEDIAHKRLRLTNAFAFAQDPARIIRAFRLQAQLDFHSGPELLRAAADSAGSLLALSPSRLGQEWMKLLSAPCAAAMSAMDKAGILSLLLPGWEEGRGMEQNPFHHLPVLEHNLAALAALESILRHPPAALTTALSDASALKMAALLHDLGKPATMRPKAPGWNSFHNHDQVGGEMTWQACLQLGLGPSLAQQTGDLVRKHMLAHHLLNACQRHPQARSRLLGRFLHRHQNVMDQLFLLALADIRAGQGRQRPPQLEQELLRMWEELEQLRQGRDLPPPLLNGHDIMRALNLAPGPQLGRILNRLRQYQLEGLIHDRQQALAQAKKWRHEKGAGGSG
jgi:poly(A) polymerase